MTQPANQLAPGSDAWRAIGADEPIVDPEQRIVDPHHHLWPAGSALPYTVDDLLADVGSGHRVERTVFMECHSSYRTDGPAELAPVGETEFVADASRRTEGLIAAMVGHTDLRLANLDEVLDAHEEAGRGLFRGIRDPLCRPEPGQGLMMPGGAPEGLCEDPEFVAGVRRLGARGLTYDSWHYHYQNREMLALAHAAPDTQMVLDHFGTPIGIGRWAEQRDAVFAEWQRDIAALAGCDNVVAKLGGLAMPDNGFGWHVAARPPTSDEIVAAQSRYYLHTIECFGADRCMFESNFPVDRMSLSYPVLWNAFKKMVRDASVAERDALFWGTASRVYRLE
jgi:predicted TIM-barrel fold metal-dependent hydrolase